MKGISSSFFVLCSKFTQPKSVLVQTYSFFSDVGLHEFNLLFENRSLPTSSGIQPKSLLVPVGYVPVSKTWRILGSLFLFQRKFNSPRLAKKLLKMALRPLLKRMTDITNLRYLKFAANSLIRAPSICFVFTPMSRFLQN